MGDIHFNKNAGNKIPDSYEDISSFSNGRKTYQ